MRFEINKRGMNKVFADVGAQVKAAVEGVANEYQGRPVEEVTTALDAAFRRVGLEPGDLSYLAEPISKGEPLPPIVIN